MHDRVSISYIEVEYIVMSFANPDFFATMSLVRNLVFTLRVEIDQPDLPPTYEIIEVDCLYLKH